MLWTSDEFLAFGQESTQPKPYRILHSVNTGLVKAANSTQYSKLWANHSIFRICVIILNMLKGVTVLFGSFSLGPLYPFFGPLGVLLSNSMPGTGSLEILVSDLDFMFEGLPFSDSF